LMPSSSASTVRPVTTPVMIRLPSGTRTRAPTTGSRRSSEADR
jgi:hypothetical protein